MESTIVFDEDYPNVFIGLFTCFSDFIFSVTYQSIGNSMLQNLILTSQRVNMRLLSDFFQEERRDGRDLIYSDIIEITLPSVSTLPDQVRKYINKHTMHISLKTEKISMDDEIYRESVRALVNNIMFFVKALDTDIRPEYEEAYYELPIQNMKSYVLKLIIDYEIVNCDGIA